MLRDLITNRYKIAMRRNSFPFHRLCSTILGGCQHGCVVDLGHQQGLYSENWPQSCHAL